MIKNILSIFGGLFLTFAFTVCGMILFNAYHVRDAIFDNTGEFMLVRVDTYESDEELNKNYKNAVGEENYIPVGGYASIDMRNPLFDICRVHVPDPNIEDYETDGNVFTAWGHELAHCTYGDYHD